MSSPATSKWPTVQCGDVLYKCSNNIYSSLDHWQFILFIEKIEYQRGSCNKGVSTNFVAMFDIAPNLLRFVKKVPVVGVFCQFVLRSYCIVCMLYKSHITYPVAHLNTPTFSVKAVHHGFYNIQLVFYGEVDKVGVHQNVVWRAQLCVVLEEQSWRNLLSVKPDKISTGKSIL